MDCCKESELGPFSLRTVLWSAQLLIFLSKLFSCLITLQRCYLVFSKKPLRPSHNFLLNYTQACSYEGNWLHWTLFGLIRMHATLCLVYILKHCSFTSSLSYLYTAICWSIIQHPNKIY